MVLASGIGPSYAKLVDGVWARKGEQDQWVKLKLTADSDGLVKVVIGTNQITFRVKRGVLETGKLRISGDVVQVFENDLLVCQIPIEDIPAEPADYKQFCYDKLPPVVRVTPSPAPNSYGWNNTDVTVTVTAEDEKDGSGIKLIRYKIGTRSPVEVGTDQLTLSEGGRVATWSMSLTDEGTQYLEFQAVDQAGNESESQSLTVRIDKTRPTISGSRSPGPNAHGWNNTDVTVRFSCSDALSGIASCTGERTISSEGRDQSTTGEAIDKAGNRASTTVGNINIDKTKPSVSLSLSSTSIRQGDSIKVTITASDALSGIDTVTASDSNLGSISLSRSGDRWEGTILPTASGRVTATATDKAGNTYSTSPAAYSVTELRPAYFYVSSISVSPGTSFPTGTTARFTVTIKNTGERTAEKRITFFVDGSEKDYTYRRLSPGASTEVSFSYPFYSAGSYSIKIASPDDYSTTTVYVEAPRPAYFYVDRIATSPSRPIVGRTTTIYATITNTGGQSATKTVELWIDGSRVASKSVYISAGRTEGVEFTYTFTKSGDAKVEIRTPDHRDYIWVNVVYGGH